MEREILFKLEKLKKILKNMNSVLVAYSGGLDSSFLLKLAKDVLKDKVLAVTAYSPIYHRRELKDARIFTRQYRIKHIIIKTFQYRDPLFKKNGPQRCYLCKRELFLKLKTLAKRYKINYIVDGTNYEDLKDFRPGNRAKEEFGIHSPLEEVKLNKNQIKLLCKSMKLDIYKKPSNSCLASRIPYGEKIEISKLRQIEKAENFLNDLGFSMVRVRNYNGLARIEIDIRKIASLIRNRIKIISFFKKLGFLYVTVDIEGYRRGSMNLVL